MGKNILVAGVNGFVGKHLVESINSTDHTVIGTGMQPAADQQIAPLLQDYVVCDLTNEKEVASLPLDKIDSVINLAGLAQVGASFDNPSLYMDVNVAVHELLVKRLEQVNPIARIVAVSTGAVYDNLQAMPLTESSKLVVTGSPYAQSKIAMENMLGKCVANGMDIVIARPFNHIGPGQLGGFLVPDLAAQIRDGDEVRVGNLNTKRDYTDVRDVVRAYVALATVPTLNHNLYNVCSGKSVSGETILDSLLSAFDKAKESLDIQVDKSKIRPNDPMDIYGSNQRLSADTGWKPTIPLNTTITDFVSELM